MSGLESSVQQTSNPEGRCAIYEYCPIQQEPTLEHRRRQCCFTNPAACIYRNNPPYVKGVLKDLSTEQYMEIIQRLIARPPIT